MPTARKLLTPVRSEPSLSLMAAASTGTAQALCAVCTAKRTGGRVPKRKCTCNSGDTATRNRAPIGRYAEREGRDADVIMFGPKSAAMIDMPTAEYDSLLNFAYEDDFSGCRGFFEVCQSGDLELVKSLSARGCKDSRVSWQLFWREAVSSACESGQLEVLRYLLSISSVSLTDLCPFNEPFEDPNAGIDRGLLVGQTLYEPVPNPAPPLWIAAESGHCELVSHLFQQGADPNQPAFDRATPFFRACSNGDMPMVRLLQSFGVDMLAADQDGTAPVHAAAVNGHVDVIKYLLHEGVSMESKGTVFIDSEWQSAMVNATALTIAQRCGHKEVVQFLQSAAPTAEAPAEKRMKQSQLPFHVR